MQSRIQSLFESVANTAIGYIIALASQLAIFPLFNIHIALQDYLLIGAWFTAISLARSYVLRRWFTRRTECPLPATDQAATDCLQALVSLRNSSLLAEQPGLAASQVEAWDREWDRAARVLARS